MKRFLKGAYIILIIVIAILLFPFFFPKSGRDETTSSPNSSGVSTDQYEPYKDAKYQKMITKALNTVSKNGDEGSIETTGVMILKRYENYLKEIQNNNAYIGYDSKRVSEVYLYYAFINMMKKEVIDKVVENTKKGKDGLDGITGLFERPYYSHYDKALDSYIIYLPTDYDSAKNYPLVVLLHGYGGSVYVERAATENDALMNNCEEKDVILVCPNGRHKLPYEYGGYMNKSMEDVLQVIEDVKVNYTIDTGRIYLTGLSMGGYGTWNISSKHPEIFAAIAPLCGYGEDDIDLQQLVEIPVYAFHGDQDATVSNRITISMVNSLKNLGGNVTYLELKGYGHNIWDYVYEEMDLLEWFLQYHK